MAEIEREDKYNIRVYGKRVAATPEQEARIRAMDSEQLARFAKIMGVDCDDRMS